MSEFLLPDAEATDSLGARLAQALPERAVVYLHGDLGAGKSTLARALLRALGVTGTIRSPTYTLVEQYVLPNRGLLEGGLALHLDLYRIGNPGELEFLGLDPADARLWLVEWPERGRGSLPGADLEIALAVEGQGRHCRLLPNTAAGAAWVGGLASGLDIPR
jgi:tRNA threonylcarbamoyladenosine biosynthesis protein TsaE